MAAASQRVFLRSSALGGSDPSKELGSSSSFFKTELGEGGGLNGIPEVPFSAPFSSKRNWGGGNSPGDLNGIPLEAPCSKNFGRTEVGESWGPAPPARLGC